MLRYGDAAGWNDDITAFRLSIDAGGYNAASCTDGKFKPMVKAQAPGEDLGRQGQRSMLRFQSG